MRLVSTPAILVPESSSAPCSRPGGFRHAGLGRKSCAESGTIPRLAQGRRRRAAWRRDSPAIACQGSRRARPHGGASCMLSAARSLTGLPVRRFVRTGSGARRLAMAPALSPAVRNDIEHGAAAASWPGLWMLSLRPGFGPAADWRAESRLHRPVCARGSSCSIRRRAMR